MSIIIALVAMWWVYQLHNKVDKIQNELRSFTGTNSNTVEQSTVVQKESFAQVDTLPIAVPVETTVVATQAIMSTPTASASAVVSTAPAQVSQATNTPSEFFLYTWFKEHTLIKVGALIFFLGAVWFVSYAISEGWLSPTLRITLGLLCGLIMYALGWLRKKQNAQQYLVFTTLGTGIVLASVFAAQFMFELFAPVVALLIMVLSIAYCVYVSIHMKTQWLASLAVVAGLCAPLLTNAPEPDMNSFMLYLIFLSIGFSAVVFFTHWRSVTAVLVTGVSFFELSAQSQMAFPLLWIFVIIFAGLFLTSITISLFRAQKPESLDVISLAIVGFVYTYFASQLSVFDGLALFSASVVLASIGYLFHLRQSDKQVIAVYASFASVAWLVGTSFLLEGYSLLLALTIEITFAFLILAYTQSSLRVLKIAALAFFVPIIASIPVFTATAWNDGVVHSEALALLVLAVALLTSFLWLQERSATKAASWCTSLSAKVGALGFVYTLIVLGRIGSALPGAETTDGSVFEYLLFGAFILMCYTYLLKRDIPFSWVRVVAWTFVLPVLLSLPSFSVQGWNKSGVLHPGAYGVYGMLLILCAAVLVSIERHVNEGNAKYQLLSGTLLTTFIVYLSGTIFMFWNNLFAVETGAIFVLVYVSYAGVLYVVLHLLTQFKLPLSWLRYTKIAWAVPVMLSLQSLSLELWEGSVLQPQAAGLFVMLCVSLLLGLTSLHTHAVDEKEQKTNRIFATVFFSVAGFYAVALVWLSAHVLSITSDIAVAISLFVYTIVGLGMYVFGSSNKNQQIKYGGMVLLIVVVLRLGFYEIWVMQMFWRIITFLGIGALFMLAALLERKPAAAVSREVN